MARRLRPQPPGGIHHVMSRGVAGLLLFRTDEDRDLFLATVEDTVLRHEWICLAYVVLGTHYHLLVRTPEPDDLARGMKRLNGNYAQGFNRRNGGRGHVLESRYASVLVENDGHLRWLFRYLAWNPVNAGLADDPKNWPWSSYPRLLGLPQARPPRFLAVDAALGLFGRTRTAARARLRDFVEGADPAALSRRRPRPPLPGEPARAA